MNARLNGWSRPFALLGMSIALNVCSEAMSASHEDKEALPAITAQIGDTWDEVIQNSTFKLGPLPMAAGTIINQPHTFVYRDPHHRMEIGNVGHMGVSVDYKTRRIQDFGIGPYRESAEADETWRRLQEIIDKMERAGWMADEDRNKRNPVSRSAVELRNKYFNLPGGAGGAQRFWYDEYGHEAWVALVKTVTGRSSGEEPRFNVVLQIQVAAHPKKLPAAR